MRQCTKQWEALGMSRATWYRHSKPSKKPKHKMTQAEIAKAAHISLRGFQRARRIARFAPDLMPLVQDGSLMLGSAEKMLADRFNIEAMRLAMQEASLKK
jgi:hypothetical protein